MIQCVRENDTAQALRSILPGRAPHDRAGELAGHCDFDHAGILVFPGSAQDVQDLLVSRTFEIVTVLPSVVVRDRLRQRYGLAGKAAPVTIVRGRDVSPRGEGRQIEVFVLPRRACEELPAALPVRERREENETHLAFRVRDDDTRTLRLLRDLAGRYRMRPDGGGHNPGDEADRGGRSVLYFAVPRTDAQEAPGVHRIELFSAGEHTRALDEHLNAIDRQDGHTGAPPSESGLPIADGSSELRLLNLITAYWSAQAVHAAAVTGVADALADGPRTAAQVAAVTSCDPAAMARLLRFLAHIGLLRVDAELGYGTTGVLDLLRSDNPFRDLTLLYGEEFYRAWGEFPHAVRTGKSAFGQAFGDEHFEYFKAHQDSARRFDRAMAATTQMIANDLCQAFPFPPAARIVDVGGGDGTLLEAVLSRTPAASGVLVDLEHVVAQAGKSRAGSDGRMTMVTGDFFEHIPAEGEVFLLSRVLHDWDDQDCDTILRTCRKALDDSAHLLIIERLLPVDGSASLAVAWDLQMLAVTGGRERTRADYAGLLSGAGFTLTSVRPLGLDLNLLVARPS
ncbi:methyltransferase [Streptosporangium sp. CA-135522]|uniref:methyltransferase n=1 Tax=Streptosporangium sp. CA-135522 TaxID=3240072 RepID=UPI003D8C4B4B